MKKTQSDVIESDADEMRPEYDFRGGVRGKHAQTYRQGHTVTIHREDGTTTVQYFDRDSRRHEMSLFTFDV